MYGIRLMVKPDIKAPVDPLVEFSRFRSFLLENENIKT